MRITCGYGSVFYTIPWLILIIFQKRNSLEFFLSYLCCSERHKVDSSEGVMEGAVDCPHFKFKVFQMDLEENGKAYLNLLRNRSPLTRAILRSITAFLLSKKFPM